MNAFAGLHEIADEFDRVLLRRLRLAIVAECEQELTIIERDIAEMRADPSHDARILQETELARAFLKDMIEQTERPSEDQIPAYQA